jgi:hypothetical protein
MSISILVAFFLLAQGLGDSEDEIRLRLVASTKLLGKQQGCVRRRR